MFLEYNNMNTVDVCISLGACVCLVSNVWHIKMSIYGSVLGLFVYKIHVEPKGYAN